MVRILGLSRVTATMTAFKPMTIEGFVDTAPTSPAGQVAKPRRDDG